MKDKRGLVFLSIFALAYLFAKTRWRLSSRIGHWKEDLKDGVRLEMQLRSCGNFLFCAMLFIIPIIFGGIVSHIFPEIEAPEVGWFIIYLGGVLAAYCHMRWRDKHKAYIFATEHEEGIDNDESNK